MDELTLAYIAGYLDADGSITIHRRNQRKGCKHPVFMLYLYLVNRDREVLDLCCSEFGGRVRQNTVSRKRPSYQPCYEWRIASAQAERFIRAILPFLRQKRPQANLALEYRASISPAFRGGLPAEILAARENLYRRMSELNHRGA